MRFRTLDAADVKGRRVLVRVDFNVPMQNGEVADVSRIERNTPTITEIADRGGKVIILSHYGRPKGRDPRESLKPVVAAVARIIHRPIGFAGDCVAEVAELAVAAMKPGEILCLENTRFHPGEEKNDADFAASVLTALRRAPLSPVLAASRATSSIAAALLGRCASTCAKSFSASASLLGAAWRSVSSASAYSAFRFFGSASAAFLKCAMASGSLPRLLSMVPSSSSIRLLCGIRDRAWSAYL